MCSKNRSGWVSAAPETNLIGASKSKRNSTEKEVLSEGSRMTILAQLLGRGSQQTTHRSVTDAKVAGNGPQGQTLGF
jgi:hypothetical protein